MIVPIICDCLEAKSAVHRSNDSGATRAKISIPTLELPKSCCARSDRLVTTEFTPDGMSRALFFL
jgi:hypothetical protein